MSSTTDRYRAGILDEHRDRQIRRLQLLRHSHSLAAGDGSNRKGGEMGAGYVQLKKKRKRQQRKVGREEQGSSSNRPELSAFVLALRGNPCDNPHALFVRQPSAAESCKKTEVKAGKQR